MDFVIKSKAVQKGTLFECSLILVHRFEVSL